LGRQQRRQGQAVGPLAWFGVQGVIDDQVVRAVWTDGRLRCDRLLGARARLLVDLGAEFCSDDPPRRYQASLQAPPVAVLLTLIRACDQATVMEADLGPTPPTSTRPPIHAAPLGRRSRKLVFWECANAHPPRRADPIVRPPLLPGVGRRRRPIDGR
jgi:hypothetical protein